MRTVLHAALAGLIAVVPVAAQTAGKATASKPDTRKIESRETFVAVLSGAYEVPAVETRASGTADLTLVGSRLSYRVHVQSVKDVTGVYIHIGRAGGDQPVVADLCEGLNRGPASGLVASGTLRAADLHGASMARLRRALQEDDAYITVHTVAHPGGVMRGQLRIQPMVASR